MKSKSPSKYPSSSKEEAKGMAGSTSQFSLSQDSDNGPTMSDLVKCYVMNKTHQLKSRFAYISDMTLFVTYLSENGEQLIVALSIELLKSHVMTDTPRFINKSTGKITTAKEAAAAAEVAPTTA